MRVAVVGHQGKVGRVLVPALQRAGHEVLGFGRGTPLLVDGCDAAISPPWRTGPNLRAPAGGHRRHATAADADTTNGQRSQHARLQGWIPRAMAGGSG